MVQTFSEKATSPKMQQEVVVVVVVVVVVWIHWIRLPILLVVRSIGKMDISLSPFEPKRIWSRETGSAVPSRVSPLIGFLPISAAAASIYYFKPQYAIGSVPSSSGHEFAN